MITRNEAIDAIESVLRDAAGRVTKPLKPEQVVAFRAEFLAADDENPHRFPTTSILSKYVRFRTSAKPAVQTEATSDPPKDTKRKAVRQTKKPILDDMSPSGENALRGLEGE